MLEQIYADYAKTLNKVWAHDRSKTVGASEIGLCARQTFWVKTEGTKRGVKRDEDYSEDFGARMRGTIMEEAWWYPAMQARFGDKLLYAGPNQRTLIAGHLSATPDAIIIDQPYDALKHLGVRNIKSDCFMAECKTVDPRTTLAEAKDINFFQTQTQMGLMRKLTPHKPEFNLLTYTDASFWSEVVEFPIQFDPTVFAAAESRATKIISASNGNELKPEGWIAGGKQCQWCPFTKACGVARARVPYRSREATPQFAAEITDLARETNRAQRAANKATERVKELQVEIKDRMREKNVKRIEGVVNWYATAAPRRWDNKAIRARMLELGEDISGFEEIGEPSDRIVIAANPAASRVIRKKPVKRKTQKAKLKKGKTNGRSRKTASSRRRNNSRR